MISKNLIYSIILFFVLFAGFNITTSVNLIPSGDVVPATLLPYSVLYEHTLSFDYFSDQIHLNPGLDYSFSSINGHYFSIFPIVTPILAIPVYAVLYSIYSLLGLTAQLWEMALWGKIAASCICAFSGVVFYHVMKRFVTGNFALLATFVYAFATSTWSVSSQALWQHGTMELIIILLFYFVIKNEETNRNYYIFFMGILSGLLVFGRPPDVLLLLPFILYVLPKLRYWIAGILLAGIPFVSYNFVIFGTFFGGYTANMGHIAFTPSIISHAVAILVAPNLGFFVFCPVLLLAIFGIPREGTMRNFLVISLVSIAGLILLYSCYDWWVSGTAFCYGYRFLIGAIPTLAICTGVATERLWKKGNLARTVVISLVILSFVIQVIGVCFYPYYPDYKKAITEDRVWNYGDMIIPGALQEWNQTAFFNIYSIPPFPSIIYVKFANRG